MDLAAPYHRFHPLLQQVWQGRESESSFVIGILERVEADWFLPMNTFENGVEMLVCKT